MSHSLQAVLPAMWRKSLQCGLIPKLAAVSPVMVLFGCLLKANPVVTSRHRIRKSTVRRNSDWKFGFLVVSTADGVGFVWPAWSRERAIYTDVAALACFRVWVVRDFNSVTPSYAWPLFWSHFPLLLFMILYFEMVSHICFMAAFSNEKFWMNEWMSFARLMTSPKRLLLCNLVNEGIIKSYQPASWVVFGMQEPQINSIFL